MTDWTEPTQDERKAAHDRANARYFAAPGDQRIEAIRAAVVALAVAIDLHTPPGRNKSIAQTELEHVQMRAGRGVWAPEGQK